MHILLSTTHSPTLPSIQSFTYLDIVNQEFPETTRKEMLGLLGTAITNVWHTLLALESTANTVVNTLGFTPVRLQEITQIMTKLPINNVHLQE